MPTNAVGRCRADRAKLVACIRAVPGGVCLATAPLRAHNGGMARKETCGLLAAATALTFVCAAPLAAQAPAVIKAAPGKTTKPHPKPRWRAFAVPGQGTVYVVPVQPKDTRSPKERCQEEEIAREGGSPSVLAQGAIDLKCSQS